jgi:drug/metabolite transporter (DMT)-like permease
VAVALVFAMCVAIWSTTWLVIRVGLADMPPYFSIAVRFYAAGLIILALMRIRGERIPLEPGAQPFFALLGFLSFVLGYGTVYWAEQYLTSGLTAAIFGFLPVVTGVLAHFLLRGMEPLAIRRAVGLAIGLTGILVINRSDLHLIHPMAPIASLALAASVVATAFYNVLSKRRTLEFSVLALAGMPMLYGALGCTVLWLLLEGGRPIHWTGPATAAIAYLTVFGSVLGFIGYFWLLRRIEVNRANLIAFMFPVVALAVGRIFADEPVTPIMLLGAGLVLAGVAVANRARAA